MQGSNEPYMDALSRAGRGGFLAQLLGPTALERRGVQPEPQGRWALAWLAGFPALGLMGKDSTIQTMGEWP